MTDALALFLWILAANSGLLVFDFLSSSILKEVLSALQTGKPGVFSPGKPKEFLVNYKSSLKFLSFLEGIAYCLNSYYALCSVTSCAFMWLLWKLLTIFLKGLFYPTIIGFSCHFM